MNRFIGLLLLFFPIAVMPRTATTKENIEKEAQVHATKGDLGEKALEKEESLDVKSFKDKIPEFGPGIIEKKYPPVRNKN